MGSVLGGMGVMAVAWLLTSHNTSFGHNIAIISCYQLYSCSTHDAVLTILTVPKSAVTGAVWAMAYAV